MFVYPYQITDDNFTKICYIEYRKKIHQLANIKLKNDSPLIYFISSTILDYFIGSNKSNKTE